MLTVRRNIPERYTQATDEELNTLITDARAELGERLLILGHHYQRDEVVAWADVMGDSFGLSRIAADRSDAEFVVFCGVHFMAESADVLTGPHQKVVLPDLAAGCSMADMADIDQVNRAWKEIAIVMDSSTVIPITYMNSTAAIKSFVGEHGGAVCTSSNAAAVLTWALGSQQLPAQGEKLLFLPDQHLGRNTALAMGYEDADLAIWDPAKQLGGLSVEALERARILLWKGHCSVHQRFTVEQIEAFRARNPQGVVIVHPECSREVVDAADQSGSTDFIIKAVNALEAGSAVAIGTEVNLVHRIAASHPELRIELLEEEVCPCSTMSRIDLPHLAWVIDELRMGTIVNQVTVDTQTAQWAKVALDRMLAII
jgi:quinolinate synthase